MREIIWYDTVVSTNLVCFELAEGETQEGTVIAASSQTAGRGRMGRKWFSPPDAGLYFSILIHPHLEPQRLVIIPVVCGIAVVAAIEQLADIPVKLKWPNDVLVCGKKVCGVLVETRKRAKKLVTVAGVGINLNNTQFPLELADAATSLNLATGKEFEPKAVLHLILKKFDFWYRKLLDDELDEIQTFAKEYSSLIGRKVSLLVGREEICGKVVDIGMMGGLVVDVMNGTRRTFTSGEVRRVK